MKSKKSLLTFVAIFALLIVLAAGGVLMYTILPRHSSTNTTAHVATFQFDASKATGWFAGANIVADGNSASATNEKAATATRIIAQGTSEKPTGDCFVQYEYWANSTKDPAQVVKEKAAPSDPATAGTFSLQPTNTLSLAMKTPTGNTPYQLHQYIVTGPDAAQMSDGEEFAALKAGTGYIVISGYCKTADQLSVTLPVLTAVSFEL